MPAAGSIKNVDQEPTSAPPANSDLTTSWKFLETGVDRIMLRLHTGMSYSYYMLLYTCCYNYCVLNKAPDTGGFSGGRTGANLMGSDLYNKLTKYFQDHLRKLKEQSAPLSDLALLQFYTENWERYTTGANYVNRLFTYLNRHWVKREKDEGRKGIYPVYTLALVQWKENFFLSLMKNKGSRLIESVLSQIENQRNGEEINTKLVKQVVDSLVALGLEESENNPRASLDVYRENFQVPFLKATEEYYRKESKEFLAQNSVSDYLKKAEGRLAEEEGRVERYLHSSTKKPLIAKCEAVLVAEHRNLMQEEFQTLLDADRSEDLARMWGLLVRIPDGLEPLRLRFEEHVKKSGLAAVEKLSVGGTDGEGKAEQVAPKAYIEALLAVQKKNLEVVNVSFRGEQGFTASLDKACRTYCNHNSVAMSASKTPELLASFVDAMLRKSNKDQGDESMEDSLNDCMTIFKYIDDKDVFQKFYSNNLSNRLIKGLSASDEAEGSMMSKLRETCGYEYTSKLQKMITDMSLSKDLTENFKEKMRQTHSAEELDVDLNIIVGASNNWPLVAADHEFAIPRSLVPTYDRFIRYYTNAHNGRKLTWFWFSSKAEVKVNCFPGRKYTFLCNLYQAAVLLLFNDTVSMTKAELMEATKLPELKIDPVLHILVKAKILTREDDVYDLNMKFSSKSIRVNLNQPVRSEQKAESVEVLKTVDDDRKHVYQATIVRLMKSRKQMKHHALITEVAGMLKALFQPKVAEMKKAIDHLLDKEYIERVEGTKDTYNYLA